MIKKRENLSLCDAPKCLVEIDFQIHWVRLVVCSGTKCTQSGSNQVLQFAIIC